MARKLASFFQIRSGEEGLALMGAAFFLLVQGGQVLAANTADALLFERFGVEVLPLLFIVLGAATLIASTGYSAVLGRPDRVRLSLGLLVAAATLAGVGWAATFVAPASVYPALWLAVALINALVGTMIWVLVGEVCDPRQAKRLFAFFASAGILGSVLAGFLTGPAARGLGTQTLLLFFGASLLIGAAIAARMTRRFARTAAPIGRTSALEQLRRAHRRVWRNPTMRLVAVSAVLFSILFFSVTFPFNVQVSAAFPEEADLAGFLGVFGGVTTAVTFLVSLLLASRVYARLGIINAILLLPLVYLAGFVLWSIDLSLPTASIFRFAQLVLVGGLASSAYANLFNIVPADQRAQVRAYQAGLPAQAGVMVSGALLLIGQHGLTQAQALAIGIVFSIVCVATVWRMRASYGRSLVEALRQGVTDVFAPSAALPGAPTEDAQARAVARDGLRDPRPTIRRASLEILARLKATEHAAAVADLRQDEDPEVRAEAAIALGTLASPESEVWLRRFLEDQVPAVRTSALAGLTVLGRIRREDLEPFLSDPVPRIRAEAAVAAAHVGEGELAKHVIDDLLADERTEARLAGLQACARVGGRQATGRLIQALHESPRTLRLAAIDALRADPGPDGMRAVVACLDDPDPILRRAAGKALSEWEGAQDSLLEILRTGSAPAQDEAVLALRGADGGARPAILRWAEEQLAAAERLRAWRDALRAEAQDGARGYLTALLEREQGRSERRVLLALGSVERRDWMRVVGLGLRSSDRDLRSQALEALETIGDRRVAQGLIRLIEPTDSLHPAMSADQALSDLTRHPRAWYRILSLRVRAEAIAAAWDEVRRLAGADAEPLVRSALATAGAIPPGGMMIETSPTLGTMQRVLFLRDVPLFRLLEPEDLERIAAFTQERLYEPGEPICREGEVGDEMHVLVEGSVEVRKRADGVERLLRRLEAGEHVGELAILREQPRSASVICQTPVRTLVLQGEALRSILEERPAVGMAMLESMAERMSTLG